MPTTTTGGMSWEPPSPEELQRLLPQFSISSLLGRGGMGAVYRAIQTSLDREVAIKLLPPELGADPNFEARFKREAKAMARLNHPNIVQIHEFGQTTEGHHYFVMEYVDGTDLHQLIRSGGLDAQGALNAVSQICDALEYAHSEGFVHRDIKPANIFINTKGILKVGDFGLAKVVETDPQKVTSEALLTMTGVVMGTPQYIAPEQLEAEGHVDQRADIYSLGVMFYEMLTGAPPRGAVHSPSEYIKNLDVRVDGVVFRAMEPDPGLRYQTAADLRTDVDVIRTTPAQGTPSPSKKRALPKRVPMAVVVPLVLVVAAGVGVVIFQPWSRKPSTAQAKSPFTTTTPAPAAKFASSPAEATKDTPYVNSLGMKFVPVPGTDVLMSVWETRVRDYSTFLRESTYVWYEKAPFEQTPDHPVIMVSWKDAKAFCEWLSTKEHLHYRLPTDEEWSAAVGKDRFPWGNEWPPLANVENISGEERREQGKWWLAGYRDSHPGTAPVGSYSVNRIGLFDMGGNVRELLEGWYDEPLYEKHLAAGGGNFSSELLTDIKQGNARRVVRGGGWFFFNPPDLLSASRGFCPQSHERYPQYGFRVALQIGSFSKGVLPQPTPQQTEAPKASTPTPTQPVVVVATKDKPFVNSLGMKFVPVPETKVLFSLWETRVRDWNAFLKESKYVWSEKAGFEQTPDDPVVMVSWDDAKAFCAWLSNREKRDYRLPTDEEWSVAVGSGKYPWGEDWPPPKYAGNFPGEESELGDSCDPMPGNRLAGWKDAHPRTAPVGSYRANRLGLYDFSGNVWEWCEDWFDEAVLEKRRSTGLGDPPANILPDIKKGDVRRVTRGGGWSGANQGGLLSGNRGHILPDGRDRTDLGFRCVVVAGTLSTSSPQQAPTP